MDGDDGTALHVGCLHRTNWNAWIDCVGNGQEAHWNFVGERTNSQELYPDSSDLLPFFINPRGGDPGKGVSQMGLEVV